MDGDVAVRVVEVALLHPSTASQNGDEDLGRGRGGLWCGGMARARRTITYATASAQEGAAEKIKAEGVVADLRLLPFDAEHPGEVVAAGWDCLPLPVQVRDVGVQVDTLTVETKTLKGMYFQPVETKSFFERDELSTG